jgi:hypothetical protein
MQWITSNLGIIMIVPGVILLLISCFKYSRRTGDYFRCFLNFGRLNMNVKERIIGLLGFILIIVGVFM